MSCRIEPDREVALPPNWRPVEPRGKVEVPAQSTEKSADAAVQEELRQARGKIAQLEQAMAKGVRDAHEAGLREGEGAGQKKAAAEIEPAIERLTGAVAELAELRGRILREAEADLLKLALEIARRVVHRELRVEPEAVDALLRYALDKASEHQVHRLRVHPEQEARVRAALERLGHPEIEVTGDPSLERGGAVFATDRGNLDASIETQFREIEQGLADRFERQGRG